LAPNCQNQNIISDETKKNLPPQDSKKLDPKFKGIDNYGIIDPDSWTESMYVIIKGNITLADVLETDPFC